MRKLKMRRNKTDGFLITFCGLDGCGKTSMIQQLAAEFEKNHTVLLTKQPTDFIRKTDIFRTYMDSPDHGAYDYRSLSLLAASDRLQHTHQVILPALERGQVVISDRYYYSCLANLRARGFTEDRWIYEIAESVIEPDIAFFLDVPVETAVARVRSRTAEKDRYIDMALQYRLREEYIRICDKNGGIRITAARPPCETYARVICEVNKHWRTKNGHH